MLKETHISEISHFLAKNPPLVYSCSFFTCTEFSFSKPLCHNCTYMLCTVLYTMHTMHLKWIMYILYQCYEHPSIIFRSSCFWLKREYSRELVVGQGQFDCFILGILCLQFQKRHGFVVPVSDILYASKSISICIMIAINRHAANIKFGIFWWHRNALNPGHVVLALCLPCNFTIDNFNLIFLDSWEISIVSGGLNTFFHFGFGHMYIVPLWLYSQNGWMSKRNDNMNLYLCRV